MTTPEEAAVRAEYQAILHAFRQEQERFQTLETLGEGGFGRVVRCFDHALYRVTARKELHRREPPNPGHLKMMINEVRLISYLDHPGVVPLYDVSIGDDDTFQYSMKVLDGDNLDDWMELREERNERVPISQALQIFTKLCETMDFVHNKGVLHLDIKPANVILGEYGEVLLVDWGAALLFERARYRAYLRQFGKHAEDNILQDHIQGVLGSIPYMPLEQMTTPRAKLTPAADIFAAGVLLYRLLTGASPYPTDDDTVGNYVLTLHSKEPVPLQQRRGDTPSRLAALCHRMLRKQPIERFASFRDILDELREISDTGQSFDTQNFLPGEVIFREGESGDIALQIIAGEVEISVIRDGARQILAHRHSGDIVGELAVFSSGQRNATVTARVPTTAKLMTRDQIEGELNKLNPWISQMISGLSNKFIEATHKRIAEKKSLL